MATKSEIWGRIRYIAFLSLFVSLLAIYWTYSNEVALSSAGAQILTYPSRGYTVLFVLISVLLFCLYVYSGFRQNRKT